MGVEYISPKDDVDLISAKIRNCTFCIAEALHGAIVAHAFDKPVIPVIINQKTFNRFKWRDFYYNYTADVNFNAFTKPSKYLEVAKKHVVNKFKLNYVQKERYKIFLKEK